MQNSHNTIENSALVSLQGRSTAILFFSDRVGSILDGIPLRFCQIFSREYAPIFRVQVHS